MKNLSILLIVILLQFCTSNKKVETDNQKEAPAKKSMPTPITNFLITTNSIGNVKIGQSMDELKRNYEGYSISSVPAWNYCLDGGGDGVEISNGNEKLLFVCPTFGIDTVCIVMALSPKFFTTDGLRPSASIGQLLKRHPALKINNNMMCAGEFFKDDSKKMIYEFASSDTSLVGVYKEGAFSTSEFDTTRKIERIWISKFYN